MRFNFKKVASILASVAMLGSTIGFAAAANYPAPFVSGSASDVAIVVGQAAASSDIIAAVDIATNLQAALPTTSTTSTSTASGGDSVQMARATNKLNLQNNLADVWTTKITDSDMPNLLADGTYRSKDNIDYIYEQYIDLAPATLSDGLNFTHFDDDDYKKDTPSLGIKIAKNAYILNYTLDFKKYPRSDVSSAGRLEDLEDRDITILGKTYKLLNAYNASTSTKLELMKGAATETIALNEEKTISVNGKDYTITLSFVDSDEAQFTIVDSEGTSQSTNKLVKGGTEKLADGTQVGVTDISYQAFSGGVMSAQVTLGANKISIENDAVLEVDDIDEDSINCYITRDEVSANKADIKKIILEWKTEDEMFVTADSQAVFPGISTLKITAGAATIPCEETVQVKAQGTYGIEMIVPIKDGDAKISLLYGNATDFTSIGGDIGENLLRTANDTGGDFITFDQDIDDYFVASWNSSTEAESYLLKVSSVTESSDVHQNYTTVENIITGTKYTNKKAGDKITIGNIELEIITIDEDNNWVLFTINTGGTFNRIYTAGGLGIWLPINDTTPDGALAVDSGNWEAALNETYAAPDYTLYMTEEDKDGNLGAGGGVNVTLDQASSEAQVTEVSDMGVKLWAASGYKEIGDTDVYEGYIGSDLGTKVLFKKPTSGAKTADIIYHCSQMSGNVFVTAPDVSISGGGTTTGGSTLGSVTVYDSEISKVSSKNLVVVGGSCVNTVAAKILNGAGCSDSFTTATGVGADQALIKVVTSPYASDKIAMLVAGYEAADTTKAVKYVTTSSPSTAVGEIKLSTSSTVATVVA